MPFIAVTLENFKLKWLFILGLQIPFYSKHVTIENPLCNLPVFGTFNSKSVLSEIFNGIFAKCSVRSNFFDIALELIEVFSSLLVVASQ